MLDVHHNFCSVTAALDCFLKEIASQGSLIEAIAFLRYYSQLCLDYSDLHGNERLLT